MRKLLNDRAGFTLVELMITIVIVGILAAVAVPLYQLNVKRAKTAEADAVLGSVRTALRVYYAENVRYPGPYTNARVDTIGVDIMPADFNGTYLTISEYTYTSTDCVNYNIEANSSSLGITRRMKQDGSLANF